MSAPSAASTAPPVPPARNDSLMRPGAGPLVNLLESKPNDAAQADTHALPRFDDSQVPPEAGAMSEQPEASAVRQMRAELEMHRHNAKAGVAFVSQSGNEQQQSVRRAPHSRAARHQKSRATVDRRRRHAQRRIESQSPSSSSSYTSDSRTLSGSSHTRTANADTVLSKAVHESIRDDERAGALADARRYAKPEAGETTPASSTAAPTSKLDSAKSFVKSNLTLIVTCIVLLALVGVTVYLMFKSNSDSAERDNERERASVLAADEERLHERDAVLQDLQRENEKLKTAFEKTSDTVRQYEQHLNQYQAQNSAQMEALEALEAQNTAYERAVDEWQRFYARLEPQYVEDNAAALVEEQQQPENENASPVASEQTIAVKEERANTPAAAQSDTEQQYYNGDDDDDNDLVQQDEQDQQEEQQTKRDDVGGSSPTKLLPPLENREQVPFGTLADAQKQTLQTE